MPMHLAEVEDLKVVSNEPLVRLDQMGKNTGKLVEIGISIATLSCFPSREGPKRGGFGGQYQDEVPPRFAGNQEDR